MVHVGQFGPWLLWPSALVKMLDPPWPANVDDDSWDAAACVTQERYTWDYMGHHGSLRARMNVCVCVFVCVFVCVGYANVNGINACIVHFRISIFAYSASSTACLDRCKWFIWAQLMRHQAEVGRHLFLSTLASEWSELASRRKAAVNRQFAFSWEFCSVDHSAAPEQPVHILHIFQQLYIHTNMVFG